MEHGLKLIIKLKIKLINPLNRSFLSSPQPQRNILGATTFQLYFVSNHHICCDSVIPPPPTPIHKLPVCLQFYAKLFANIHFLCLFLYCLNAAPYSVGIGGKNSPRAMTKEQAPAACSQHIIWEELVFAQMVSDTCCVVDQKFKLGVIVVEKY